MSIVIGFRDDREATIAAVAIDTASEGNLGGSAAIPIMRRTTDPVFVSAMKRSSDSRSRSERNMRRVPSGLSAGPRCSRALPA